MDATFLLLVLSCHHLTCVFLTLATTAMPLADIDERPAKKRRFFADESPNAPRIQPGPPALDGEVEIENGTSEQQVGFGSADSAFDGTTLESILGEKLESHDVDTLRRLSGNNVERGRGQIVSGRCTRANTHQQSISTSMARGKRRRHAPRYSKP